MSKIKYPYEFAPDKRKIAKRYARGKLLLYFIGLLISLGAVLLILFSGLNISIRNFVSHYPLSTQFYGFIILLIFTIVGFPLAFYTTFVYDHKFKLSRYKISGWIRDYLKSNLISYIISLIIISGIYFTTRTFSPWWVYAGIFYMIFSTFMNYIFPLVIVPFMWKVAPYKNKSMKNKILNLCRKLGVTNIRNIVVINESEKSIRPNAVFMGFGNSKRIGLFDTLLNNFTNDEVEVVVGHELGHYVNKDILRGLVLETISIFVILFAVNYFVGIFAPSLGLYNISDLAALPLIMLIYGILGFFLMPITNTHSRWREAHADKFALDHVRKPVAQISTEKRLADMHLSDLSPHPLVEIWLFSHPSTSRRIRMAENWKRTLKK